MRKPIVIKLISGLLNIAASLIVAAVVVFSQDFGKGDLYAFVFWTVPLAIGFSVSGRPLLELFKTNNFFLRLMIIVLLSALVAFGWFYFVYWILGPWINTFSFPIFYLWIIGSSAQLLFLDKLLHGESGDKQIRHLFFFPLSVGFTFVAIYGLSSLGSYVNRPEKELFLIPSDFEGQFRVVYGEECGLDPAQENGRMVLEIPKSRVLIIKPEFKAGVIDNEYYLVDKDGKRQKIEVIYQAEQRSVSSPSILFSGSGGMGGEMPDGSYSTDSPLAIDFTNFTVFNKDTSMMNQREYFKFQQKFDSLTEKLVEGCRKEKAK